MNAFVAIDIGSGLTKFSDGSAHHSFPSIVGSYNNHNDFSYDIKPYHEIHSDGKTWLTGPVALSYVKESQRSVTTKATWCEDRAQLILFYSVFANLHPDGYKGQVNVVSGLPMARFASHQKTHKKMFVGTHVFSTSKAKYELIIDDNNIEVLPQCIGLHFSNISNNREVKWGEHIVGYIDPGTHTTDFACVDNGAYMNVKSSGEDVGLYKLAKAMKPILEEQYSWTPDDNELLASLRKGVVLMHGDKPETIDLREIAQICVPKVYAKLFDSIEAYWGNARSMHVLISSGGGHYILDHLKKRFPHAALLNKPKRGKEKEALNDAIFDVVDGYAIYGKAKFTQNVTHINVKTKANA
jgi:hypothetical protein